MAIIYLDLEYDNDRNIIEIGALCVSNGNILREFHRLVRTTVRDLFRYNRCAQHSHCIHTNTLTTYGVALTDALQDFREFIGSELITLCGHGDDMKADNLRAVMPFLREMQNVNYAQVHLPGWNTRQRESYFHSALRLRLCSKLYGCSSNYHAMQYLPTWKLLDDSPTHTQIAKLIYNYHCALIDVYLLAFFEGTLPMYCCDEHFMHVYNTPIINTDIPIRYCTNIFEEIKPF